MAFHSTSKVIMEDGSVRRLDSFTEEEREEMSRKWTERIARAAQDYINQHPEQAASIFAALESAGFTVTYHNREDKQGCA